MPQSIQPPLTADLAERSADRSIMLQNVKYAASAVARLFISRLRRWIDEGQWRPGPGEDENAYARRIREVLEILMEHGDEKVIASLHAAAKAELAAGANDA